MTTEYESLPPDRKAAVDAVAQQTGKTVQDVLAAIAPTWTDPRPRLHIAHIDHTREQAAQAADRRNDAAQAAAVARSTIARRRAEADAEAVQAFETYAEAKRTNPFKAARIYGEQHAQIERGRELTDAPNPTDDPPPAAA